MDRKTLRDDSAPLDDLVELPNRILQYLQSGVRVPVAAPAPAPARGPESKKPKPTPPTPAARAREKKAVEAVQAAPRIVPLKGALQQLPDLPKVEPLRLPPPNLAGIARPSAPAPSPQAPVPTQPLNPDPAAPGLSPAPAEPVDPRARLYSQLMAKLQGGDDRTAQMNLANSWAANMQKNANYMGSTAGGRMSGNTSMTDMANDIRNQSQTRQADQDKVREYLLDQMRRNDEFDVEMKRRRDDLAARGATAEAALTSKERMAREANDARIKAAAVRNGEGRPLTEYQKMRLIGDLAKSTDPTAATSSTGFGKQQALIDEAERLERTMNRVAARPGGQPDNREMEEIALGTARLIQGGVGGTPALAVIKALVPSSVGSDMAKLKEWLTNKPQGNEQQAFMKRMREMSREIHGTAKESIRRTQESRLKSLQHLEKIAPEAYQNIKQQRLGEQPPSVVPANTNVDAEKIRKYAEKYKLTPEEARRVLIKKGVITGG